MSVPLLRCRQTFTCLLFGSGSLPARNVIGLFSVAHTSSVLPFAFTPLALDIVIGTMSSSRTNIRMSFISCCLLLTQDDDNAMLCGWSKGWPRAGLPQHAGISHGCLRQWFFYRVHAVLHECARFKDSHYL